MQLSRFTDYSLRVLLYTAVHSDRLTTLAEVADFFDVSLEHLRKVVHAMSKSGDLKTYRGKHGGFTLGKPADEINIGKIIAQSEKQGNLIDCSGQHCRLDGQCSLQPILWEAKQAFMSVLERYTLADLLDHPEMRQTLIATDLFQEATVPQAANG
jgi:Rrf2 family nitric oxide-sensitive transcriptional repressor